jgi:hypothetical protein
MHTHLKPALCQAYTDMFRQNAEKFQLSSMKIDQSMQSSDTDVMDDCIRQKHGIEGKEFCIEHT